METYQIKRNRLYISKLLTVLFVIIITKYIYINFCICYMKIRLLNYTVKPNYLSRNKVKRLINIT